MRTTSLTFLLLLMAACDNGDKSDVDGDGVATPADCDDGNADVKPGAVEACDGIDNDCDGQVDEGVAPLYYLDADGDGAGDALAEGVPFCAPEAGYASDATDCDDGDASVNPLAAEDCTMVDRNCDGDPYRGASDETVWYVDTDADGFGAPDASQTSCAQPAGYVDNSDDCDDYSDLAFPGAEETCNGRDDDCDGTADNNATDAVMGYVDADGDGYGDPATGALMCDGFGVALQGDDCDDTNDQINPAKRDICDGLDNDCDPSTSEDDVAGITYWADADGDGYGLDGGELKACAPPTGAVYEDGDCNDGDAYINPDADEVCDAVDHDCDGDPEAGAVDTTRYYADADADGVGSSYDYTDSCSAVPGYLLTDGDCDDSDPTFSSYTVYPDDDGDGYGDANHPGILGCAIEPYTLDATDCDDGSGINYPGAPELCDGVDNDCDPSTDENLVAVWYEDADGDGFGDEGNTYTGCAPETSSLVNPTQVGGDCDDADALLNPTLTPVCIKEHCGTIAGDETWKSTVEHVVTCTVNVEGPDKPHLIVQDGAIVTFVSGAALEVGNGDVGSIDVQGFSQGVVFTSDEALPQEGDWKGVVVGDDADPSTLQGLTIEYAGSNGAGLTLATSDVIVWESIFSRNTGDGVKVTAGEPLIYDSMMVDNENNGLYVSANQGLSRLDANGTTGPSFTGNYIAGNGARPVTIPGSHADELALSSQLNDATNPNATREIELLSGTMRSTGVWQAHPEDPTGVFTTDLLPYYVAERAIIEVEDGPQAHLTLADGIEVRWDEAAELEIGVGAEGRLTIGENGPAGILFTATPEMIVNGLNFSGIEFGANDGGSIVDGLTIEYGGSNGLGSLYVNGSAPLLTNLVVRNSDSDGIYVTGSAAAPVISFSEVVDNDENGVYVASSSAIARGGDSFAGNTISGNGASPVVMPPNYVGELDDTTTFSGNGERIFIHGGTVQRAATWQKLDEDYQLTGTLTVAGPQDPELTIEPGTQIYVERDLTITVGTNDDGALLVDAIGNPVRFTSADPVPGAGDWYGILLGDNGPLFQQSRLRGVEVEYAGGSDADEFGAAIELSAQAGSGGQRLVLLEDVTVTRSSKMGLYINGENGGGYASLSDYTVDTPYVGYCFWVEDDGDVASAANVVCNGLSLGRFPYHVAELMVAAAPTFGGPVVLESSEVVEDTTLFDFAGTYHVWEPVTVPAGVSLTVGTNAEMLFGATAGIESEGSLTVQTGTYLGPLQASWQGLTFSGGDVDLFGATLDGAGDQGDAAIVSADTTGTLDSVVMLNSTQACDLLDEGRDAYGTCVTAPCLTVTNFMGQICP